MDLNAQVNSSLETEQLMASDHSLPHHNGQNRTNSPAPPITGYQFNLIRKGAVSSESPHISS